jgi:hypothetical protein
VVKKQRVAVICGREWSLLYTPPPHPSEEGE